MRGTWLGVMALMVVSSSDPAREMVSRLAAKGPHPAIAERAKLFDRFVGTWEADYAQYAGDGSVSRQAGEVIFGWIIDGHALQDIWIWHPSGTGERRIGTSIRVFDNKLEAWRVIWISPTESRVVEMRGGAEGERIVLLGTAEDGSRLRWSFNDIRPASFVWRGERSRDNGKTWRLTDEYQMRRRSVGREEPR